MHHLLAEASAVLFDLDGVLTPTASVHERAWARMFTEVFAELGVTPPFTDADYFEHLDGKPRYQAVAALLSDRGVELPWGSPQDAPDQHTVCGIGNRKNALFLAVLTEEGADPYPGSVALLDELQRAGVPVAVVSSSRNALAVLTAAGLLSRFAVIVDGTYAIEHGLAGKPAPDTYLAAAKLLGAAPERAVVVEDAISGVAAGRAGSVGLVVGVDRGAGRAALTAAGADLVVADLGELVGAE
ncbi:MAG TPA: beta-phosphoglucomutase family hydrolase [Microbacteriaceae bacterium]|nr:beta-phosphoglucomutase family hydrolase [Microbacteriaceae bacterium]